LPPEKKIVEAASDDKDFWIIERRPKFLFSASDKDGYSQQP
jgi:hypothetical protein